MMKPMNIYIPVFVVSPIKHQAALARIINNRRISHDNNNNNNNNNKTNDRWRKNNRTTSGSDQGWKNL